MDNFKLNAKQYQFGGEPNKINFLDIMLNSKYKQTPFDPDPDFSNIETTRNRGYNPDYIAYINKKLIEKGYDRDKRAIILGTIIEESGGDPFAISDNKEYKGLLQWEPSRFEFEHSKDVYKEIDNQLNHIYNTIDNLSDKKSWTHGGKGSGYNHNYEAYNMFNSIIVPLSERNKAFSYGYVRPKDKGWSVKNRLEVIKQVLNRLGNYGK